VARIAPQLLRQRVGELPALPQVVLDVQAVLRDDSARMDDCAERVSRDQGLATRTLRLANSAFYGVAGRVATIHDAVQVLGLRTLGSALTTAAVAGSFAPPRCEGFKFAAFWRHSLATAIAAGALARVLQMDEDTAFTAGLLHDVGRLALATHFSEELAATLALAQRADVPALEAEMTVLGIDHAAVGALIAGHWHFPTAVCEAIAQHHAPAGAGTAATLADLVHVADAITHALDLSQLDADMVPPLAGAAWDRLQLSNELVLQVFEQTETQLQSLCEVLAI
jgi:putative nucleotidyltransferase with HDIG domain